MINGFQSLFDGSCRAAQDTTEQKHTYKVSTMC